MPDPYDCQPGACGRPELERLAGKGRSRIGVIGFGTVLVLGGGLIVGLGRIRVLGGGLIVGLGRIRALGGGLIVGLGDFFGLGPVLGDRLGGVGGVGGAGSCVGRHQSSGR